MSSLEVAFEHRYPDGFELAVAFAAKGGVTAVVGPSGSGKTTTLGVIAGILRPKAGRVELGGRVLLDTERGIFLAPEERGVGFVFQDYLLFPHRTVRENLLYGRRRRPVRKIDLDRVVELLELGTLLDRYPRTLSGGEKQRTALGRAILRGPRLLLLDEPLSALDDALKARILVDVERVLAEYQLPAILVSHNRADVERLANQIVALGANDAPLGAKGGKPKSP